MNDNAMFAAIHHRATALIMTAVVLTIAGQVAAQSALAQLSLTETAARSFVLDEIKSPAANRRSAIAVAGTRAFLKLPPSARAAAATGLFAWARAYVNSPGFKATYTSYRNGSLHPPRQYDLTVEEAVKRDIDEQLADIEARKKVAGSLPPQDRAAVLEAIREHEKQLRNPEFVTQMQEALAAERANTDGNDAAATARANERAPADPNRIFARRLREFLDATVDVDFSTRTISLTGGPDGIEFIDPAVRSKPWMWHEAVIVGPEATAAARAAAQAWLKEIE